MEVFYGFTVLMGFFLGEEGNQDLKENKRQGGCWIESSAEKESFSSWNLRGNELESLKRKYIGNGIDTVTAVTIIMAKYDNRYCDCGK